MGFDNLSEIDKKVYEYIKTGDFQKNKWSTPVAAKKLGLKEDEVYSALVNLAKHIKDNIWIYYEDGGIRVVAE
ncbi:MAG: hypothetical protein JSV49_03815 [Thermoplasmata archaeon]|nr:MAG: hypothetical protein JSV49_03815 [Thermoplasmata archaeon]